MKKIIDKLTKQCINAENELFKQIDKLPNSLGKCECKAVTYIDTVAYGEMDYPYVRRTCLECGGEVEKPE